ncbi:MAG TPA: LacI family DNA-binding transcriptional regulator [Gryllotalpicola sp.]
MASSPAPRRIGERATLADVAALAGVSTSTASLAFRTAGSITDRTRARVLHAARELDYAGPNPTARSLKRGKSGIVGVIVAEQVRFAFMNPVTIATMDGLSEVLDELNCGQLLLPGRAEPGASGPNIADMPLDGIVFVTRGEELERLLPSLRARRIPMVGIEGPHYDDVSLVEIDDYAAMRLVAEHVHGLGHERVGVVMRTTRPAVTAEPGPVRLIGEVTGTVTNRTIGERLRAVVGLWPRAAVVEAGGRLADAGEAAAQRLLSLEPRPTAILAQNDQLASGVLRAAARRGLRVPEDLTVTGFDGAELPWLDRELTTVAQPLHERGRLAGRMIGQLMAGAHPANVVIPVSLREGETAGPPPAE